MSTRTARISTEVSNNSGKAGSASQEVPSGAGAWMAGFFLLGILLGMLGSLVITWHYHIDVSPRAIGLHFLGMSAGFVTASLLVPRVFFRAPIRTVGICATALAFLSLASLYFIAPPAAADLRVGVLAVAGLSAGALTYSLFYANQTLFVDSPASSANRAGALFVGGGLLATVVNGTTYFAGNIDIQPAILSIVPGIYFLLLLLNRFRPALYSPRRHREDILRETLKDLRSIATMLFSLLIFFQFAGEWAMAGWLPLFLIHTLGINPVTAISGLGVYFLSLMAGRLVAQVLMPIVSHRKMLMVSVALSMSGYLVLSLTNLTFVALTAVITIGVAHAPIYPLIAERLDDRFSYHPGFYSGTLSVAMAGAMATPWLLGYVAEALGMRAVMLVPCVASILVFILAVLIMLESRLMGSKQDDPSRILLASDK